MHCDGNRKCYHQTSWPFVTVIVIFFVMEKYISPIWISAAWVYLEKSPWVFSTAVFLWRLPVLHDSPIDFMCYPTMDTYIQPGLPKPSEESTYYPADGWQKKNTIATLIKDCFCIILQEVASNQILLKQASRKSDNAFIMRQREL